jgi:hypothetical protein
MRSGFVNIAGNECLRNLGVKQVKSLLLASARFGAATQQKPAFRKQAHSE